jgi:hypothetical protein
MALRISRKMHAPLECQFPLCGKTYKHRSQLDDHHVVPRSMGGPDMPWNMLRLCPGCHRKIYVPGMTSGIHSMKLLGSIVVHGKVKTSHGWALHYTLAEMGQEFLWLQDRKENSLLEKSLLPSC